MSPDIRELVDRNWTADEFERARAARRGLHDLFHRFAEPFHLVLTPATAFPAGLRFPRDDECGIADGRAWSPFAFLANLTGHAAVSIPAGRAPGGLPIGLQAIGPRFGDPLLLDLAQALEELRPPGVVLDVIMPWVRRDRRCPAELRRRNGATRSGPLT